MRISLFIVLILFIACGSENPKVEEVKETAPPGIIELLIGTYTGEDSEGIYLADFSVDSGIIRNIRLVAETDNPSYLAISPDRENVYSVNEGKNGGVTSWRWKQDRSGLMEISRRKSHGDWPCYVAVNSNESLLATTNYGTGNVVVYPIEPSGELGRNSSIYQHRGSGPHANQAGPHGHCTVFGRFEKHIYAVDLGIDQVKAYPIREGGVIGGSRIAFHTSPGDGPRHMVFDPSRDLVYIVNELSSTVISAVVDHEKGSFRHLDKKSTLPNDYDGPNTCADIHISKNGRFLYASNRGHNSIAVFRVFEDGRFGLIENVSTEGETPRNFTLTPDNKFLLVANQNSDNITVFKVEPTSGRLKYTGHQVSVSKPVCLKF